MAECTFRFPPLTARYRLLIAVSPLLHRMDHVKHGARAYHQGTLCATVYRMLTTGPFERPGQEDPIPCINFGLGLFYLLASLALLGDAIFYAPTRCSPVIADGTRPFSECSKFLAAFECRATQTCTGTTFEFLGNTPYPYPYCPTVGATIPYKATITASQCNSIKTSEILRSSDGSTYTSTTKFDVETCQKNAACANAMSTTATYTSARDPQHPATQVAWTTPDKLDVRQVTTPRKVEPSSKTATFHSCTGFYKAEVCPDMTITIGAATGYMGILSALLTALYNFLAGRSRMNAAAARAFTRARRCRAGWH